MTTDALIYFFFLVLESLYSYHLSTKSHNWMFQVSQVYQTMKITSLSKMIPFYDFPVVEKLSVDVLMYNFLQLNIDHSKGIVQFGFQVKRFNFIVFITMNAKSSFDLRMMLLCMECFWEWGCYKILGGFISVGPWLWQDSK